MAVPGWCGLETGSRGLRHRRRSPPVLPMSRPAWSEPTTPHDGARESRLRVHSVHEPANCKLDYFGTDRRLNHHDRNWTACVGQVHRQSPGAWVALQSGSVSAASWMHPSHLGSRGPDDRRGSWRHAATSFTSVVMVLGSFCVHGCGIRASLVCRSASLAQPARLRTRPRSARQPPDRPGRCSAATRPIAVCRSVICVPPASDVGRY